MTHTTQPKQATLNMVSITDDRPCENALFIVTCNALIDPADVQADSDRLQLVMIGSTRHEWSLN